MTSQSKAALAYMQVVTAAQLKAIESALVLNYVSIGKHLREWDDHAFRICAFTPWCVARLEREVWPDAVFGDAQQPTRRARRYLHALEALGRVEKAFRCSNIQRYSLPRAVCDQMAADAYNRLKAGGMPLDAARNRADH